MFEDTRLELERILSLVQMCPERLQDRCFEILLNAYVDTLRGSQAKHQTETSVEGGVAADAHPKNTTIPDALKARIVSTASRVRVTVQQLASLFDFSIDPFSYHAFAAPGSTKAEKTKNIALLLATRSYISGAGWAVSWKEFRDACVDQNCFDNSNNTSTMKTPWFKSASPADGIALSSAGITAAEGLIAKMASGAAEQ